MQKEQNNLKSLIDSLNIDEAYKQQLAEHFNMMQSQLKRSEFKLEQTLRDKENSTNILNKTIKELEEKQSLIRKTNEELETQKRLVVEHSQELELSLKKLELSFNELEQFAYIASHDLKSPLRTISNFAQLLQRNYSGQMGEEADEFINFIVSGAQHMNEVICDLLEYSRVGNKNKEFSLIKMVDIFDLMKFNLAESIKEAEAKVIIEPEANELELMANRSSLLQLFQNLVGNGIKFCENRTPEIRISVKALKNAWEFRVVDNGVGMKEEYQEKVFLPFQRLNNVVRPGTGIGLAICKKSIKIHRGDIRYESTPGEGTTFIFTIPQEIMPVAALIQEVSSAVEK